MQIIFYISVMQMDFKSRSGDGFLLLFHRVPNYLVAFSKQEQENRV